MVLDGFGIAPPGPGNAIHLAAPQNYTSYLKRYPHTQLSASGVSVGLPADEVGSTEVGHLNMGAGHIVYQSLPRINLAIADGSFFKNEAFVAAAEHVKANKSALHLMGLVGSGTVHASIEHLYALLHFCKEQNIQNVFLHLITDGRDSPPKAAKNFIEEIDKKIQTMQIGQIASVSGRYYAMDRDHRWDRIEQAYTMLTTGAGRHAEHWEEVVDGSYNAGRTDEFIEPTIIADHTGTPIGLIKANDAVIFFNFRIDRPRELTKAFVLEQFEEDANKASFDPYTVKYYKKHEIALVDETRKPFTRGAKIDNLFFVTMTEYERGLPVHVAFPPHIVQMPLGRVISEAQVRQLRITESEKERFVTFYFNGLRELPFELEDRYIIPSPKVPTYNMKPEMSAYEVTDVILKKMYEKTYGFILVNYANPDMVGHTGDLDAAKKAIGAVDECLGKIVDAAIKTGYTVVVTADHGNIEAMIDFATGAPSTEHSGNMVPFLCINESLAGKSAPLQSGILADVAPTILALMGITQPPVMRGRNLLDTILR